LHFRRERCAVAAVAIAALAFIAVRGDDKILRCRIAAHWDGVAFAAIKELGCCIDPATVDPPGATFPLFASADTRSTDEGSTVDCDTLFREQHVVGCRYPALCSFRRSGSERLQPPAS
jgi:hypothetical protein